MTIYAKFVHPNSGYDKGEFARSKGLVVGDSYFVEYISMGQSYTDIYLRGYGDKLSDGFNSVYFEFFEDAECTIHIDIYSDARTNPYL